MNHPIHSMQVKTITVKHNLERYVLFGFIGLIALAAAGQSNIYVAPTGVDSDAVPGQGQSWALPYRTISNGVAHASTVGDTVLVSNGTYLVSTQIVITTAITVKSFSGNYSNTIVAADWPTYTTRCFYADGAGIVVDGFTISNGHSLVSNSVSGGGGAYIKSATIQNCYLVANICSNSAQFGGGGAFVNNGVISNCLVFSNKSYQLNATWTETGCGGGIYLYNSAARAVDCRVISNYTYYVLGLSTAGGGGIMINNSGCASNCTIAGNYAQNYGSGVSMKGSAGGLLFNCVVSNNWSTSASAIYSQGMTVRNCTIVGNTGRGGMILNSGSLVSNCVIAGNSSTVRGAGISIEGNFSVLDYYVVRDCQIFNNLCTGGAGGGGISATNSTAIWNCLIRNNTNTSGNGGGVLLGQSAVDTNRPYGLVNCTIISNWSQNGGGGVAVLGPSNFIANCIIAGNGSAAGIDVADVYNEGANSNNYWSTCANVPSTPLPPTQGNIATDPGFKDPGAGNWRLNPNSPCINTGTNQDGWMTGAFDLDGRTRIRYGRVDMGAYETLYSGTIFGVH